MLEDIIKLPEKSNEFFTKNTGNQYEFYLSGEIQSPENYIAWFDVIRNSREMDTIKIYINSSGGDLYTALQFLRVMGECEGHLITSVEGSCMSAATMIFLSGHEFQVTPHSLFMFHNYSGGVFGKGGEQYDQIQYERAWSEKFMNEVYKDFLTTEEIQSMLNNKDIWMTSEQVLERIEKVMKKLHEEQQALETNSESTGE
jgi:ATP-dependent protease ClpP protease subunit